MASLRRPGAVVGSTRCRTFVAIGLALVMSGWANFGAIPHAQAYGTQNFCTNAWLDRYGQPNDNCAANDKHYNYYVNVTPGEHSACVSVTTNTSKSGLTTGWTCTTNGSWTGRYVDPTILTNGIIRNNTTGDVNHASGGQAWCHFYICQPY